MATNDSDVDDGAVLSYALDAPVAGLTLNADGSYSFDAGNAAYQHLAAGRDDRRGRQLHRDRRARRDQHRTPDHHR